MKRDTIYSAPTATVEDFRFDESVAAVFDDMIPRSVPLYREVQASTARIIRDFAQPGSAVYDLGCSTGESLIRIAQAFEASETPLEDRPQLVGVDSSEAMLSRCRERLVSLKLEGRVELRQQDLLSAKLDQASVIILNYTLQFIPVAERLPLLMSLRRALIPGGALLIAEKITHRVPTVHRAMNELHWEFKREQGYSELEIAQKRTAIENVLIPLSLDENVELLRRAGFREVEVLLKSYTFVSLVAI